VFSCFKFSGLTHHEATRTIQLPNVSTALCVAYIVWEVVTDKSHGRCVPLWSQTRIQNFPVPRDTPNRCQAKIQGIVV